jgi:hypothetical protein
MDILSDLGFDRQSIHAGKRAVKCLALQALVEESDSDSRIAKAAC